MAKETVLIGCRLPHGLTLTVRNAEGEIVATANVNGMNSSVIKGATYTTTPVDVEIWATWKKTYGPNFQPLKNGAIFEANTEDQAKFKAKELVKVKTGFEALNPDEAAVKPRNDKD